MESLSVKMGLTESDVFHVEHTRPEPLIQETFKGRLQYSGEYPDLDILITNLALNDTGPYWCLYHKYNNIKKQTETFKAKGSVLLVVSGKPSSKTAFIATFSSARWIPPLRTLSSPKIT